MVHALNTVLQGKRPGRPSGERTMRHGLWCCVKACWQHQPSSRPKVDTIVEFLKRYRSDPSNFPEFGQINDTVPRTEQWRVKRTRDRITGGRNVPSPLGRLGMGFDAIEEEPGFMGHALREVGGSWFFFPIGLWLNCTQVLATENARTGWSW